MRKPPCLVIISTKQLLTSHPVPNSNYYPSFQSPQRKLKKLRSAVRNYPEWYMRLYPGNATLPQFGKPISSSLSR